MHLPLPKKKYANDMAKAGSYLTHMWKWYGKARGWYGYDMGSIFAKFQATLYGKCMGKKSTAWAQCFMIYMGILWVPPVNVQYRKSELWVCYGYSFICHVPEIPHSLQSFFWNIWICYGTEIKRSISFPYQIYVYPNAMEFLWNFAKYIEIP